MTVNPRIRASDAERDHAAAQLREHYAAGRLSVDECQERVSATLAARTLGELDALMTDLPDLGPAAAAAPRRTGAAGRPAVTACGSPAPCGGDRGDKVAGLWTLGIIAAAYLVTGLATGIWWIPWALVVVPAVVTIRRARRRGLAASGPTASAG
jgi:hypothetical protein